MKRRGINPRLRMLLFRIGATIVYIVAYGIIFVNSDLGLERPVFDFFCTIFLAFYWLFFFAQFVLPVDTLRRRFRAFFHLIYYSVGLHGAAVFVRNGIPVTNFGEDRSEWRGVYYLDTASAAVLRRPEKLTRAIGPGVTFTDLGERLYAAADLHWQISTLGPDESDLSPAAKQDGPANAAAGIQERNRQSTRAITRDGIEIIPTIDVIFRINTPPGQGGTGFGYADDPVIRALAGRITDLDAPPGSDQASTFWQRLPALLAADVWKEYLSCYTLEQIFSPPAKGNSMLDGLCRRIQSRLTDEFVPVVDCFGNTVGSSRQASREYRLLNDRGLVVREVTIRNLRLSKDVEAGLLKRWSASWMGLARREQELTDFRRSYQSQVSARDALRDVANHASDCLVAAAQQSNPEISGPEILSSLLASLKETCTAEPSLLASHQVQLDRLADLQGWVKQQEARQ